MKKIINVPYENKPAMVVEFPDRFEGDFYRILQSLTSQVPAGSESQYAFQDYQDFGFAWAVLGTVIAAAISKWGGKAKGLVSAAAGDLGEAAQYLVDGKFLYCNDNCGRTHRIWYDNAGTLTSKEIQREGVNKRFDCSILPSNIVQITGCQASVDIARSREAGKPTTPKGKDWWAGFTSDIKNAVGGNTIYWVGGGVIALIAYKAIKTRKRKK